MKQHITMEQLNEFMEIAIKNTGIVNINIDIYDELHEALGLRKNSYPQPEQLTIGKMIEMLDNTKYVFDIKRTKKANNWIVLQFQEHETDITLKDRYIEMRFENKELCDALWEAVKYVLEGEKE